MHIPKNVYASAEHAAAPVTMTVKASKLIEALEFVAIVKPRSLKAQQGSEAYLFRCSRQQDGRPIGYVYSRARERVARAGFELERISGDGVLTFPAQHVEVLKSIASGVVTITFRAVQGDDEFRVSVDAPGCRIYDHKTFDPRLIPPCDRDFDLARARGGATYNVEVLRAALRRAKRFLPDAAEHIPAHFSSLQIFDGSKPEWAKGNGVLFASDASRAFYLESDALRDNGLALHLGDLGVVEDFLSRCDGLTIYGGEGLSFAADESANHARDRILGWSRAAPTYPRYAYYALRRDKYVILARKAELLRVLGQAEVLLQRSTDRMKLSYRHADSRTGGHSLFFRSSESAGFAEGMPVETFDKVGEPSLQENFDCFIIAKNFRSIVDDVEGPMVELRLSPIPKDESHPRGGAMIRTIEEIEIAGDDCNSGARQSFTCRVTRFMPSTV